MTWNDFSHRLARAEWAFELLPQHSFYERPTLMCFVTLLISHFSFLTDYDVHYICRLRRFEHSEFDPLNPLNTGVELQQIQLPGPQTSLQTLPLSSPPQGAARNCWIHETLGLCSK